MYIVVIRYGAFVDEWNLHVDQVEKWGEVSADQAIAQGWQCAHIHSQYVVDAEVVYSVVIFLTKFSILFLYIHLFLGNRGRKSKIYWAIYGVLWFNILFYTANTFGEIFYCTPRKKAWIPSTPGHCVNVYGLIISSAAINAFSDLMMIIIPLCVIWRLKLNTRHKIGVSIVFMFGIL